MNAQKCASLLLSATLLAGSLSACNRTIIEHQFHTNTEYITETVVETEVIEKVVNYSEDFQNLEKLFNDNSVSLVIMIENVLGGSGSYIEDEKVESQEMTKWLEGPAENSDELKLVSKIDASIIQTDEREAQSSYQLLEGTLKHISEYYEAFRELTPEQWEEFPLRASTAMITSSAYHDDGVFYVVTTISSGFSS